jgi:hypothetical protein
MEENAAPVLVFDSGWLLWAAAAVSFLLLCLAGPIAGAWLDRGRNGGKRAGRAVLSIAIPAAGLIPTLVAADATGFGIVFHAIFFSLFCYFFGQSTGWTQGSDHMAEMMGIESPNAVEEMQDRLLESGMRLPSRAEVVKSISELARKRETETPSPPDAPVSF